MSNGNVSKARAFFLAALIVSSGGCDRGAAPPRGLNLVANAPESRSPNVRYQVDPVRNRVWLLTGDGVLVYDVAAPEKVVAVPLTSWLWLGAPYGCLPDLALGPKGEAVITSDIFPTLWRIDPKTLAVSVHPLVLDADTQKDVGFSGLVYSPGHGAYFAVSHVHGSFWKIDRLLRTAEKIPLATPVPKACGLALQQIIARRDR